MLNFRPLAYMLAVILGVIVGAAIAVQAWGLVPGALTSVFSIFAVVPAWALFLPSTLFALRLMDRLNWQSVLHHCLMGSASAALTVAFLLVVSALVGGLPANVNGLGQALWYLVAAAVGGFVGGYVYWGSAKEQDPPTKA